MLLVLAALAAWWLWPEPTGVAPSLEVDDAPRGRQAGRLPEIELARLEAPRGAVAVGGRDLFAFDAPPASREAATLVAQVLAPTPPPLTRSARPIPEPTPATRLANVRFIGRLEREGGLQVAVLLTEHDEVLTGRVGDLVGQRFTIVEIGLESVDIKDVGSDRVRRLPLKGN